MYLPCESIGRRFLPIIRCHIAKELIEKYGLTQIEVAKKLGTTQAAISQYLRLKRGAGDLEEFKEILPIIQSAASELASEIASGRINADKIALRFCELCLFIQKTAERK
ncbi:helix-turn-helix domain-containing protein [Candidatus Bathyarchaeota archaeon]|nr:helix-turn-helix domain-containing protein [Candidatus Bathyarchaeota archaeon]